MGVRMDFTETVLTKRKPRIEPVRADALFKGLEEGDLRRIKLRETTAGALEAEESQRFWIERGFEDAKSQAGMAEYQVRGWQAWHHHMALVMMTILFMTKQRILYKDDCPLLSCYDIRVLLAYFLSSRKNSVQEILRQMEIRHRKRKTASESAAQKRK